jgi:2-keto-4-pentenoate hydratase/2-oxohepta-3-ene-1,7-dioic acid hydratase in catechol pathway
MRLVTFSVTVGKQRVGALVDGDMAIVDLSSGAKLLGRSDVSFGEMLALIDGGDRALDDARRIIEDVVAKGLEDALIKKDGVEVLAPVPVPRQMRDFLTFEQHLRTAREMRLKKMAARTSDPAATFQDYLRRGMVTPPKVWYQQPIYYKCNRFSVVGTNTDVRWPSYAAVLDYELEFGIVLGKGGANISADKAKANIFGYTIFNDFSARDAQAQEMEGQLGPAKGKDFDTGNVMGPCLVTADEIPNPYALSMKARVNGEEWSSGNSSTMRYTFEQIIEFVSRDETLHAGEFFGSGTVGGGCGLELDKWLSPNDVVELEVEHIGILRNRIVKPPSDVQATKTNTVSSLGKE